MPIKDYDDDDLDDSEVEEEKKSKTSPTMKMMFQAHSLKEAGMSLDGIHNQLNKSINWVKGSLLIVNELPSSVHKAIEENKISRIAAIQLLLCPKENLDKAVEACLKLYETEGKL